MDGRVKILRYTLCIALGLVLGGVFGLVIWRFTPICPNVDLIDLVGVPTLATTTAPIYFAGIDTPEQSSIRLVFVGDIMLDRNVKERMRIAKDLAYPFRKLPAGWFNSFDYAVANLEGALTDKRRAPEKSIDFQFDPAVAPILKTQGIDAFSQANNHALDQGNPGYADSVRRLREAGFLVFGHQVQDDAISLATTTVQGRRLAFLGFNTTDNPIDRDAASQSITLAKQQADTVIVYMHWGTEYRDKPDASSVELAHWFIDNGVDIVIGGHPHWAQGFSTYKGKPIVWSLGNFVFDQDWSAQTRQGLAVEIEIGDRIVVKPIPLQIDASQPRIVEGEERAKRLEALSKISDATLAKQIRDGVVAWPQYGTDPTP
ncbi:CapA family protein [Candidatus Uhrbacteria bacterium]|nr:CapA family protein [Candidatus Uhrbacteria bacterium]